MHGYSLRGDRGFESGSLQQRVCKPSVPRERSGFTQLPPHTRTAIGGDRDPRRRMMSIGVIAEIYLPYLSMSSVLQANLSPRQKQAPKTGRQYEKYLRRTMSREK